MITSDRKARMMLSCAIDGGDPAVAELVQNLGAEGAWAKIIEGLLGEPAAQRAAQIKVEVFERLAEAAASAFHRSRRRGVAGLGLMICDMRRASNGAVASRSVCGYAALDISPT